MSTSAVVILTTCPSRAVGQRIAKALLKQRLAACVNIVPGIESHYRWEGRLESSKEVLLILKSVRSQFRAIAEEVLKNHPYEVPELIVLPIVAGSTQYLDWIKKSSRKN